MCFIFPLGAATTVTPMVWLDRYPRKNEPLGAVITDYECLRQRFRSCRDVFYS